MVLHKNTLNNIFNIFLVKQSEIEKTSCEKTKKENGIFLTHNKQIIKLVLECIPHDITIFSKTFLEPACGQGAFLIQLIVKAYLINSNPDVIKNFIEHNLFFVDINPESLKQTQKNISDFYFQLFNKKYVGEFNAYCRDFTQVKEISIFSENDDFFHLYGKFDYVLGNPPYLSLYGRRDQKKNEQQRKYFLENYNQFPATIKNGKINYVMLFIEHGMKFLKTKGRLSFVIDVSFFETAYQYCRKLLVQNYTIMSLLYNIQGFDNVASGQIIIDVLNSRPNKNKVKVLDIKNNRFALIEQKKWNNQHDEFKFRISHCYQSDKIIQSIFDKKDPTLKELYPQKNLRTCAMLLNMENRFTGQSKYYQDSTVKIYPYYRGSHALQHKYSKLHCDKYFYYDRLLQNKINDDIKKELTLKGIKNKKRIGLGESIIYDNPKVYIRQSAKEIIASFDDTPSAANNSLYVFSLRYNSKKSIDFLKYLCGLLNSTLYTFFAQQRRIIRYNQGKQPQIKISDIYQIFIPQNKYLKKRIVSLVDQIYNTPLLANKCQHEIDQLLYKYYELNQKDISIICAAVKSFLE